MGILSKFVARPRGAAILLVTLILGMAGTARAATIDTIARQAILVDMTSGTTLFEKNADQRMATSSMSKVMTMFLVFERLKAGRLKMEDTLPVSQRAWKTQGSKMFTPLNAQIRVEDLVRGVIIQSGNDASVVLAEGLDGSESSFAQDMTKRAKELGLTNSNFVNATGMPDENHYSTCRDLALLAQHLITDFPEYYHFYSETEFKFNNIKQGNRNPLLYRNMNVDGLKTGHTETAGYGLMASAERNGRRLILVVNGLPSMQARADESARLIEWGFREFETYALFKAGDTVEQASVWMGQEAKVPLVPAGDVRVTLNRADRKDLKVSVVMEAPVPAPVAKGTQIGKLVIASPNVAPKEVPLEAGTDVPKLGFFGRVAAAAKYLIVGSKASG